MDNHWVGGEVEEYETQLFRFGSQRFKIAIRQMIKEKIESGLNDMVTQLNEHLSLNETDSMVLKRSFHKLVRLYHDNAGNFLENIDKEIDALLKIPPNVLLPEDEVQLKQPTDEECENLKKEVAALKQRVERGALMKKILSEELEELSAAEKLCESVKTDMKLIDSISVIFNEGDTVQEVIDETKLLCKSVPFVDSMEMNDLFQNE